MKKKIIVISAMHGRQETVKYCLDKMPFIDVVMIYTTEEDGAFLKEQNVFATAQFKNSPLSFKWNAAIMTLEQVEFDAVILLGSDDYVDQKFVEFVSEKIKDFDMIGFEDIYFKEDDKLFHWLGYEGSRQGEPIGAGKVYTKKFLERIKYNLFDEARNRGLDGTSWRRCKAVNAKILVTTLKENDLFLCDVKDGEGMTELKNLTNIVRIE